MAPAKEKRNIKSNASSTNTSNVVDIQVRSWLGNYFDIEQKVSERFPFILKSMHDLKLTEISTLLSAYKELVLKLALIELSPNSVPSLTPSILSMTYCLNNADKQRTACGEGSKKR